MKKLIITYLIFIINIVPVNAGRKISSLAYYYECSFERVASFKEKFQNAPAQYNFQFLAPGSGKYLVPEKSAGSNWRSFAFQVTLNSEGEGKLNVKESLYDKDEVFSFSVKDYSHDAPPEVRVNNSLSVSQGQIDYKVSCQ